MAVKFFSYEALDGRGRRVRGVEEALGRDLAVDALRNRSIFVTRIEESAEAPTGQKASPLARFLPAASASDLVLFYRRLSALAGAGIPLVEALRSISSQTRKPKFRAVLTAVSDDVSQGRSFSDALSKHPAQFSDLAVNLVRVGEAGGILAPLLEQVADFTERDQRLKSEVRTALAYPLMVLTLAVLTVVFLLLTVVPKLESLFEGLRVDLPLPTRILLGLSGALQRHWLWLLPLLVVAVAAVVQAAKRPAGRRLLDEVKLKVPLASALVRRSSIARFSRSLGVLAAGGVPLMQGLDVVKRVLGNLVLTEAVERVQDRVRKGESLARALRREPVIPEMATTMISAGEDSGQLGPMLLRVADMYELESRQMIKVTVDLLAPLMILAVAGIVGFIAFAMLLPIFKINQMVG